jgi:predicted permease
MSKLLINVLAPCLSFGPLFMTSMGSHGSGAYSSVGSLIGSVVVGFGLMVMFRHMMKQDQLIKELQSQIGNVNAQTD